ncbi:MAG: molybdopterin-containing oxidoreductase family protein [Thermoleophilia bacterium]
MALRPLGESLREYDKVVATTCNNMCESACGMLVYVKDGKVVDIKGDPESPNNQGSLCCKGSGQFQHIYNPLRVKYPMVRETFDDEFKRASWDAALDFAAGRLQKLKDEYGPEALYIQRTGRSDLNWKEGAARFGKLFGTPNVVGQGPICCESPGVATHYLFGARELGRLMNPSMDWVNSRCILVAGSNMGATEVITTNWVLNARERGARVIWVDPRFHPSMAKADIALQLRPNTDAALGMAMIHVILKEDLYNHEFVERWVKGLDEWWPVIDAMPPERAEKITWVPRERIIEAARTFATNSPASMTGCLGTAQTYNSNNMNRVWGSLLAITGNIGVRGGGWNWLHNCRPPLNPGRDLAEVERPLKTSFTPGGKPAGERLTEQHDDFTRPCVSDKLVPWADISAANFANAIFTQKPYPVRGVWWNGNMLAQMPNTHKYSSAFRNNVDIAIHNSFHPNFTYQHAHVAFPITSAFEREGLIHHGNNRLMAWYNKCIEPNWECRNDLDVVIGIVDRLGLGDWFPYRDAEHPERGDQAAWVKFFNQQDEFTAGCYKETLDPETTPKGGVMWPAGTEEEAMTFQASDARLRGTWIMYREGENYPGSDRRFPTPSGKIEIASEALRDLGWDYLPQHREGGHTPVSSEAEFSEHPFVLCTGRIVSSFHEMGHWWPWTDELEPDRFIQIHPDTAAMLGIGDGDLVIVDSELAEIEGFAWVTEETDPRQVWICCSTDEFQLFVPPSTNRNVSFLVDDIITDPVYNQAEFKAQLVMVYRKGSDRAAALERSRDFIASFPEYGIDSDVFYHEGQTMPGELGHYVNRIAQSAAPRWDAEKEKVIYEGREYETGYYRAPITPSRASDDENAPALGGEVKATTAIKAGDSKRRSEQ